MAKKTNSMPIDVLRSLLDYNAETGLLFWKTAQPPKRALITKSNGYYTGLILGRYFLAHRVIWAMTTGEWPKKWIDHIDGDGLNNKLSNLREATVSQNQFNRPAQSNNTSGFKGVCRDSTGRKWMAQIKFMRKCKYLGVFNTPEEAYAAYCDAAGKYHGEFANTEGR